MRRSSSLVRAVLISVLMIVPSGAVLTPQASATLRASDSERRLPTVTPTPQQLRFGEQDLLVPRMVHLVVGEEVDVATVRTVESALGAAGVKDVRRRKPEQPPSGPFTVTVGEPATTPAVGKRLSDLGVEGPAGLPPEGYVLAAGRNSSGAHVVLAGADGDGTFYAAKTLGQLFVPHDDTFALPAVEIRDWPGMTLRGTIEGFYGTPWSHEQRLRQMDFYGDMKMNIYAYAPKDDPYHRERWDQPYPQMELDRLSELVARADANHVDFTFAISPGLSICYSSDADIDALIAKFQAVYDIGVRQFNVALDDINYTDWHCPEDPARFGTGAAGAGAAQAHLLNQVVKRFAETHDGVQRIQMVPTEYYNVGETPYKKALREQMDPSVIVEWTGIGVVPARITSTQARQAREVFGHDIFVWDNYPVNDYAAGQLLLGPFNGREAGLSDHLYGLHANPMNQSEASKIPLVTVADYVWNDRAYEPDRSMEAALRYVADGDPALVNALRRFVDVNYASILNPGNAPTLSKFVDAFWETYDTGANTVAASELEQQLTDLGAAPATIRERMSNPIFIDETAVWLDATEQWATSAAAALRMLQAQDAGDGEAAWDARRRAAKAAASARALRDDTIPHNQTAPKAGAGVLDTFVSRALELNDAWLGVTKDRPTGTTSMSTYQDNTVSRMVDGNLETFYWSAEAAGVGDFVGVDLGQVRQITSIDLAMAKSSSPSDYIQSGVLEASVDGSAWESLGEFSGQADISVEAPEGTEARYVRFRATAGQGEWVVVREFSVGQVGGVTRTVSGGPPVQNGSSLDATIDGDPETAAVSSRAPNQGEALTVEYSEARPLSGVIVLQDPEAWAAASVEVRSSGSWVPIGELHGGYTQIAEDVGQVDGIRLSWVGGDVAPATSEIIGWFAEEPAVTLSPDELAVEAGGAGTTVTATVTTRSLEPVEGTLTVAVPAGWSAEPAHKDVEISRGQSLAVPITITAPPGATPAGEVGVTLDMAGTSSTATVPARLVPAVTSDNVARSGTATASSVEQEMPQFQPRFAIDGDSATRWSSEDSDDEWLQVELAQPTRIGKAVLAWEAACGDSYTIEGSVDGTTWKTLASVSGGDCSTDELRFDSVDAVRFVRMQGVTRATTWGYSLYELELYPVAAP